MDGDPRNHIGRLFRAAVMKRYDFMGAFLLSDWKVGEIRMMPRRSGKTIQFRRPVIFKTASGPTPLTNEGL